MRALNSLIFKLNSGLLNISDIVQYVPLHINLLEWFNKPDVCMQSEVLQLLHQISKVIFVNYNPLTLCKHPHGSQILYGIGAVGFLHAYKSDSPFYIHSAIEELADTIISSNIENAQSEPTPIESATWEPRPMPTFEEFRSQLTQDITRRDSLTTSLDLPDSFLQSPWHKDRNCIDTK